MKPYIVPVIMLGIALLAVLHTKVEQSMPYWLKHMTVRQEMALGGILILALLALGTALEFGLQMHGASIGH